jgi:hypothetical protein
MGLDVWLFDYIRAIVSMFNSLTLWHTQTAVSRSEPPMSLLLVLAFCQ